MKRFLILLLALLLCQSTASAAFDYTPYQLTGDMRTFFPLIQQDNEVLTVVRSIQSNQQGTMLWWRGGTLLRCEDYDGSDGRAAAFCPMDDGSAMVVYAKAAEPAHEYQEMELTLRRWDEAGLGEAVTIPGQYAGYRQLRNGLVLLCREESGCTLTLVDLANDMQMTQATLGQGTYILSRAQREGNVWWVCVGNGTEDLLLRTVDGQTSVFTVTERVGGLYADGQGGVFLWEQAADSDSFSPIRLRHLDAALNEQASCRLSAKKLVLYLDAVQYDAEADEYRLYGSAVAVSRGIFDVFCMTCDAQLRQKSLDVRAFDYYGDWSYHVAVGPGGRAMALGYMMGGEGIPMAAVPFEELPQVNDPGISLQ